MKKFKDYLQPSESDRTQQAVDAAKRKGPDKSIILISTVRRNGDYPEVRIIQHPRNGCQDMTIIIEEPEAINCADVDRTELSKIGGT